MMDDVTASKYFITTIGGVAYRQRRRNSFLQMRINGFLKTAGALYAADLVERGAAPDVDETRAMAIVRGTLEQTMVEPVLLPADSCESRPPDAYVWSDIEHVAEQLFDAYMRSGLEANPTPPSCEALKEPNSREGCTI